MVAIDLAGKLKHKFNQASDYAWYASLAAVTHGSMAAFQYFLNHKPLSSIGTSTAIIAALSLSLGIPYIRRAPVALYNLFNSVAKKTSIPNADILADVEEIRIRSGYRHAIKTYIVEEGAVDNAWTDSVSVYLGRKLVDTLTRDELKFVIGHEIAHMRKVDGREFAFLSMPMNPLFFQFLGALIGLPFAGIAALNGYNTESMVAQGHTSLELFARCLAIVTLLPSLIAISNKYSHIVEYRADRNGVKYTDDKNSAISALTKIDQHDLLPEGALKKYLYSHPKTSSRIESIKMLPDPAA